MNFLSHYYFDRKTSDCYHVLGTVLPDLLKNADKHTSLHPEKLIHPDKNINSLIGGWKKHLEVDRHFHSSTFFKYHSHQLKLNLLPALEGSPVKPFFLGHVGIELILDNLLLTNNLVNAGDFYDQLNDCNEEVIYRFLSFAGMRNPEIFLSFFDGFKRSRYLFSYAESSQVAYALKRICMRVWQSPFTPEQEEQLTQLVAAYRLEVQPVFMEIFDLIQAALPTDSAA
ncbi:hypothetical protein MUY27_06175 [Mucilaginibacter sp. RS28]|uniref:Acyl carrier protein phosphodiesterase n=1 Tax=Mucilaginibacter straminoryzae TaxID=2932774 RepID=A0A9X1X136_9SPHI|nr:hypothetical protein [Mucilaginibacter straminoryzae]MCJ8209287.1 hypothetical protein [Mucilaginibacter straminoryzae]